jgi:hypothetical protein
VAFSIVSEMLDLRNRELMESAKVDDFIVSDHLVSLMLPIPEQSAGKCLSRSLRSGEADSISSLLGIH